MLSHNLPVKIEPQQNEVYNTKFKTNIVWKQLFHNPHIVNASYWSVNATFGTKTVADNKMTYTITTKNANQAITQPNIAFTQNHIYLLSCWLTVSEDQVVGIYTGNAVTNIANVKANVRTRIFNVFKSNVTSTRTCYIYPARNGGLPIGGTVVVEDGCLYDLTEMFGEGKETLGRFSFLSNFPNNYYDYNVDGDLVPFTIPVYGGSINIKTGLLQITKYNLDLGYLYWQYSAAQASTGKYRKACTEALFEPVAYSSSSPDLISSGYKAETGDNVYRTTQGISISTTGGIMIFDERYPLQNDLPEYANAVKGITACGVMASPVTYNLTPVEVKTLLGNNKISSNATELQLTYKNSQNENVSLTGSNEYTIEDGVFDRSVESAINLFSPKQNLNGQPYSWMPGTRNLSQNIINLDAFDTCIVGSQHLDDYPFKLKANTTYSFRLKDLEISNVIVWAQGEDQVETKLGRLGSIANWITFTVQTAQNYGIFLVCTTGLYPGFAGEDNRVELIEGDPFTYDSPFIPYSNICPIEGYTESSATVEGDRVPDSESERRLKAITRPVFQWDIGLKLKFEGYSFADGTLCQFDNKITAYSQNAIIENNECTIPFQLLDENCQGDIVAYINVSGNDYDVVVYEVYIPVIKRPKPENFLRPAIDLPQAIVASFADGADDVPLEKLNLPLLPKQDLHGYDYPWVGGGGKNKADASAFETGVLDGTTGTVEGKQNTTITSKGNGGVSWTSTSTWRGITSDYIPVKANTSYRISLTETPSYVLYAWYQADKTFISRSSYSGASPTAIMSPANASFVRFTLNEATVGTYDYHNIQFEEGSSATAYAPYENICPITGHTSASVVRAGRNLWPHGDLAGTGKSVGLPFNPNLPAVNIKYTVSGVFTSTDTDATTNNFALQFTGGNNYLQMTRGTRNSKSTTRTNEAIRQARLYASSSSSLSVNDAFTGTDIQLEIGTSASPYEPYKGEVYNVPFSVEGPNIFTRVGETDGKYINSSGTYTINGSFAVSDYLEVEPQKRYVIVDGDHGTATGVYHAWYDANKDLIRSEQWNQEFIISPSNAKYLRVSYRSDRAVTSIRVEVGIVPHGIINILTGVLTQDYAYISDLSYYNYSASMDVIYYTYRLSGAYSPETNPERLTGIASSGYRISLVQALNLTMTPYAMARANGRLYFRNDDYGGITADFKSSMSGIQAIYELEEPCVYQLTPTEVKTLLGYNNIWADTGEVEVSYYADPYLHFID